METDRTTEIEHAMSAAYDSALHNAIQHGTVHCNAIQSVKSQHHLCSCS